MKKTNNGCSFANCYVLYHSEFLFFESFSYILPYCIFFVTVCSFCLLTCLYMFIHVCKLVYSFVFSFTFACFFCLRCTFRVCFGGSEGPSGVMLLEYTGYIPV